MSKKLILKGVNIVDLIFQNGLGQSKSEVRRILKNNGIRVNDKIISDEKKIVNIDDVSENNYIKLSLGKKTHLKVKVT